MLANHYGFGLRNDEEPFAHKIPPGGNWRSLSEDEQRDFMKGAYKSGGGKSGYLRRFSWDEPSTTIVTSPMSKATCYLHPGLLPERGAYMKYNVTPTQPRNGLTVAELFCGGGLMAVGLKESGFNIVWANDFDKRAVQAYRHNLGGHVVHGDITTIDPADIPDVDVIAGGPPCQDYSAAGKGAGEEGERGKLVFAYLNIIEKKQPKAFIFENVKGLIGKRHRHTFDKLLEEFDRMGYAVSWKLINAWDYGVAQKRERVFIVGVRKDFGFSFAFPNPEPEDYRTKVLRDAIGDLPEPEKQVNGGRSKAKFRGDGSQGDKLVNPWNPSPTIRSEHHGNIEGFDPSLINHTGYGLRNDEKPWALKIPPGGNWRSLSEEEQLESWNGRIPKGGGSTNRLRKRDWNEPAGAITTTPMQKLSCQLHPGVPVNHTKKDCWTPKSGQPQHPDRAPRRFTVRECLRIQSVPDWHVFPDDISLSAQYRIVGNGVPSRVAWYLGRALAEQINEKLQEKEGETE
ncbi:DNA cytosine methyltransferase [Paludifilum halophilum]|uniref:Cytosine-specific methyltransferase n=1 Tax=Paludifilum halophilum TaxID=1642702 RepID=A0A235BAF0_9BACL|nr:DNA cytosine methyltransferase [Paludifilum halophilum]OYD08565.1 hypothetical protein CHM34_06990 [Paludifilum halophilum]